MSVNREFEEHIKHNEDNPEALKNLRSLQDLFNSLRDAGIIKELPDNTPVKGFNTSVSLPGFEKRFEKSLRFALTNLMSPTKLVGSNLIYFQEVRQRIPDIDQLSSLGMAQALQQLLLNAVEAIRYNPQQLVDREARTNEDAYEVIYQSAVLGKTNERAEEDLSISRMTFYRRQKRGINRMIEFLLSKPDVITSPN